MVFCDAEMPTIFLSSSTSAFAMPPLPLSPWQAEHFSAKIGAPCAAVPLPFGKPVPSGRMLISQLAIEASSIGLPRCGVSASETLAVAASSRTAEKTTGLSVDMLNLAARSNTPACDRVVMLVGEAQYRRLFCQFAAHRDELGAGRLHIPRFVPCAALQRRRTTIPAPRHAKAREGLAQDRLLKRRLRPAFSAVSRNHHLLDPPGAGIGDAGNLVDTGPLQRHAVGRIGDEGFDLLQE